MLQFTRTTISKEGVDTVGDYTYNLSINIQDNILTSILCQVSKNVLVDTQSTESIEPQKVEQTIQVGVMQLANGQLSSQINQDEDTITHLMKMSEYMSEIKKDLENVVKSTKK